MTNQVTKMKKEIIVKIVLTLILIAFTLILVTFADSHAEMKYRSYVVKAGDTLWGLAHRCSNHVSIPETIQVIREKNGIVGSTIYCGQIIELPIFE